MGPCVSDFGSSQGSRASLTDAAVWLAAAGAHATRINHLALASASPAHSAAVWPKKKAADRAGRTRAFRWREAKKTLALDWLFVTRKQEAGVGSGRNEDALCECVFTSCCSRERERERSCWSDGLLQEANDGRCLPFFSSFCCRL